MDGVQGGIEVKFDVRRALDAAYFIDANGNRYPYRVIERAVETDGHIYPSCSCSVEWADVET